MAVHPDLDLEVFFCHRATPREQAEAGFGVEFDWDMPLLERYRYRFLTNVASDPSVGHFAGLDTPEIRDIIREQRLHYGAPSDRIFLVPHCIDELWFRENADRLAPCRPQLRAGWKLPQDAVVFLWAAKFIPKKRPLDFLRALHAAASGGARMHGLMVGDGPLRAESETFVRERGVPATFAGFLNQSEVVKSYVAADALVLPSDGGDTWGLVVNEAMVCGRPCVVSDKVGCGPDLIIPETGTIYPLGDVRRLAELMSQFAADRASVSALGAAAAQKVRECSGEAAVRGALEAVHAVAN